MQTVDSGGGGWGEHVYLLPSLRRSPELDSQNQSQYDYCNISNRMCVTQSQYTFCNYRIALDRCIRQLGVLVQRRLCVGR
jgi:hypothetical protein